MTYTDETVLKTVTAYPNQKFSFYLEKLGSMISGGERTLDRTLQKLRKAGKLRFSKKEGWVAV